MSKKLFDFKAQMNIGDKGESDFMRFYADLKPVKSPDRAADFILSDGKTVELKTDTYGMDETANFFMEIFSDSRTGSIGGPYRALKDNIDYFVYYFKKDGTFFWFDTKTLCDTMTLIGTKCKTRDIRNKGWTAQGHLVPREWLEVVLLKKDKF